MKTCAILSYVPAPIQLYIILDGDRKAVVLTHFAFSTFLDERAGIVGFTKSCDFQNTPHIPNHEYCRLDCSSLAY